jgi:hypothetical protein
MNASSATSCVHVEVTKATSDWKKRRSNRSETNWAMVSSAAGWYDGVDMVVVADRMRWVRMGSFAKLYKGLLCRFAASHSLLETMV